MKYRLIGDRGELAHADGWPSSPGSLSTRRSLHLTRWYNRLTRWYNRLTRRYGDLTRRSGGLTSR
jgi:hypothetical protein